MQYHLLVLLPVYFFAEVPYTEAENKKEIK